MVVGLFAVGSRSYQGIESPLLLEVDMACSDLPVILPHTNVLLIFLKELDEHTLSRTVGLWWS